MTSYTYAEAYDLMMEDFNTAWSATGLQSYWMNKNKDEAAPKTKLNHAIVHIAHAAGRQGSLGGTGNRIFTRTGIITIEIFTQAGKGLQEPHALAKVATDAYEGKSSGGIWYRNVRMNEIGRMGAFFKTNVLIEFQYDEIK